MDRRIQKTRRAIFEAFSSLLSQKPYARITVQEILDAANVGRSTFYAHFSAKEDLLREICTELFAHIYETAPIPMAHSGLSQRQDRILAMLTHIFRHIRLESTMLRGILRSGSGELFLSYLKEYLDQFTDLYILSGGSTDTLDLPAGFLRSQISGSFAEAVKWWFLNDLRPEPPEMARACCALVFPLLAEVAAQSPPAQQPASVRPDGGPPEAFQELGHPNCKVPAEEIEKS
ncbi:MAG: TetR/AcrR family transcriptional regulator [Oscillibacter sp.]|jgi:AcrR family transcriptional regulator|nr:TetR/AcrR family transcriptional regulator [Oscillibacter sp.]